MKIDTHSSTPTGAASTSQTVPAGPQPRSPTPSPHNPMALQAQAPQGTDPNESPPRKLRRFNPGESPPRTPQNQIQRQLPALGAPAAPVATLLSTPVHAALPAPLELEQNLLWQLPPAAAASPPSSPVLPMIDDPQNLEP
jgi:hypothetical protein